MTVNLNLQTQDANDNFNLEPDFDIETISPDEIREKTEELRAEACDARKQIDENSVTLQEYREKLKHLIPDITEIQMIATKRAELLERCRRFEKKILSIYNRFPEILQPDKTQIISTDITILNRKLELIRAREAEAKTKLQELEKRKDKQEQNIVELRRICRLQDDLMEQREHDKENLCRSLKQELDTSKTLYVSDGRTIEKKTKTAESMSNELQVTLQSYQSQYELVTKQLAQTVQNCPPQNAQIAQKIATKQQELIKALEQFTSWWSARRILRHYEDRIEFLSNVAQKTQERHDQSYKSIEFINSQNSSRYEELKNRQSMNSQIKASIEEKRIKGEQLKEQSENLEKSFKPLPRDVDTELKQLRAQLKQLESREKSLDIELQVLGCSTGPNKAEVRYEDTKKHYRSQIQEYAILSNTIAKAKKRKEDLVKQQLCITYPLSAIQDPRLLLSEDQIPYVQAASLDLLEKLVFYPGNIDEDFLTGLLVYVHTEKIDIKSFVQAIESNYKTSEHNLDSRNAQLQNLIEIWRKWFPNDFQDENAKLISPLVNITGLTDVEIEQQAKINEYHNPKIPYNKMETNLPFSSSPLIIAEHFTYFELQLLRQIPASEFVGCGWTSNEKWTKAPHIMKFTEHFNHISTWIVYSIIKAQREDRASLVERWILIMDAAAELINYQLVFEIYSALCNPAITNFDIINDLSTDIQDLYKKYSALTTPSARFANYRSELEQHPPQAVVPYIGPFLTSLVYISDGNPSKKRLPDLKDPVINFQKFRSYAKVLNDIMAPWGKDMWFSLNDDLLKSIQTIPAVVLSDSELFNMATQQK